MVWCLGRAGKLYFSGIKHEVFFKKRRKPNWPCLRTALSDASCTPWWRAVGPEGSARDVHFGWLYAICPSSCLKAFPSSPLQPDACMSACPLPSQHPWRSWSRDSLGGSCPRSSNQWQRLSSEPERAPDVRGCCAAALPSGCSAGSPRGQLEGAAQAWLPQVTGLAELSFGTIFKARAFWMQNLSPPCASVLLHRVLFLFGWFAPRGFQWMLSLTRRAKRERKVLLSYLPRVTCGFSFSCTNSGQNSAEFLPTIIFLRWKSAAGSLLWDLGMFPYCCCLFVGWLEICCKTTGERWT